MKSQITRRGWLQSFSTVLLGWAFLCGLTYQETWAKDAPLSISFSFTNQGADAAVAQPLRITLRHSMSKTARCDVKLTAQVYTNVVPGAMAADFTVAPITLAIESLPSGETVRDVHVSFAKDGEYRVFGEASTDKGYAASEGYCFIVRNGKVYGARFFDDCEGVIILNNAMRTKGSTNDVEELRRQYQQRMKEREEIKKGVRKSTKGGSGINSGETVTLKANWTGPKQGGGTMVFPILNCKVEVERPGDIWGWTWPDTVSSGYVRNGRYSFVSDRDDLDFRVKFTMEFDGFSGKSKFSVETEGIISGGIHEKTFNWDDAQMLRNGNQFTYTAPFHAFSDVDTDAEKFDSAWGAFHGVQEVLRVANDELQTSRSVNTTVYFPTSRNVSQAASKEMWIVVGDRYDFDVLAHETGHVMNRDYNVLKSQGGSHDGSNQYDVNGNGSTFENKQLSLRLAFSEGFATYWGVSLMEKSEYGGKLANVGDKKMQDTENTTWEDSLEVFHSPWDYRGEDAEEATQRLLWDIHDYNDENYSTGTSSLADATHLGLSGMWSILKHTSDADRYENVSDFWLRNWLPGANDDARFAALTKDSLRAAETFVEMGMAPHLVKPDNFTQINLDNPNLQLEFQWEDSKRTGNQALFLNEYTLVIYREDFTIAFKKAMSPATATSYTLSQADITTIKNAIGTYSGDFIAVIFGANTPTTGDGIIKTGPYASNGVRLSRGGRYVPIVVDSSGSMSWNDPSDLRIEAAKEICNRLVSAAKAQQQKLVADLAAGVDFDDAIRGVQDFIDPPSLIPFLETIDSSGNTRIDLGIYKGVELLEAAGAAGAGIEYHSAIFLFTDGENNAGPGPVITAIEAAWARGVRVHYGWLQPGPQPAPAKGGVTTYPKSSKGSPATIEEAVRMTGGNYGLIRDAQSQLAFVNQAFNNGLTVIDNPKDISAGGDIAGQVETPNDLGGAYRIQAYRFNGQENENIRILLQAVDFDPIVSLFDKDGAYLAVDYDDNGDRNISLSATLPYTGQYVVEVRGKGSQFGKYTLLVEVENAPPFVDVSGQTTTSFGNWTLDRATGALVGSLTLQNNTGAPKSLQQKFWYVLPSTSNLRLANPDGVDANGNPYVDITAAVEAALPNVGNGDLILDPGESVTITGIRFYSRDRSVPAGFVFAVWADPPLGRVPVVLPSVLPDLQVGKTASDQLILSWMATKAGVVIEETKSLASPNWVIRDAPQLLRGDKVTVTLPVDSGTRFYRLKQK